MRTTIEITTRFCRVGNIIINRSEIANADTSTGNIVMKNGTKYNVPAKVAEHIFNDIPCSKELCGLFRDEETIEAAKEGGAK